MPGKQKVSKECRGLFSKKAFHEGDFFGQIYEGEGMFYMGGLISGKWGKESFTNANSSNLNIVNLKIFPSYGEIHI